jgi:hypothetical protein
MGIECRNLKAHFEVFLRSLYSINARSVKFLFYPLDRHSHISLLIDLGFSAVAIADRVGHESIDITCIVDGMYRRVWCTTGCNLWTCGK